MEPEDLARILDDLGERLGPTGQYVFGLAVRQVYINAVVATVLLTVVVAIGVIAGPRIYRWQLDNGNYGSRDLVAAMLGLCYGGVLALASVNALLFVPAIFNPEYAAIRDILGAIGGSR